MSIANDACSIACVFLWLSVLTVALLLTLGVLVILVRMLARATAELRDELRKSSATAVAGDVLIREVEAVIEHARSLASQ